MLKIDLSKIAAKVSLDEDQKTLTINEGEWELMGEIIKQYNDAIFSEKIFEITKDEK